MSQLSETQKKNIYIRSQFIDERIKSFSADLKNYGVNFFTYSRVYKDNKFIFLCDNEDWYKVKLENNLFDFNGFVCVNEIKSNNFSKYVVSGTPQEDVKLLSYMHTLGLWNSIDYYWVTDHYIEVTHFGGALHNPCMINFYINNSLLLEYYIFLFRQKFHDILEPPDDILLIPLNDKMPDFEENQEIFNALLTNDLKNFPLTIKNQVYSISRRQAQCLGLCLYGKTAKEIARFLDISFRTVEDHISNLKYKTEHTSLSSLLSSLTPSQISQLIYLVSPNTTTLKFKH